MTASTLLESAGSHLPDTMLPDRVFVVDRFPMTSAGKIDHRALTASVDAGWGTGRPHGTRRLDMRRSRRAVRDSSVSEV